MTKGKRWWSIDAPYQREHKLHHQCRSVRLLREQWMIQAFAMLHALRMLDESKPAEAYVALLDGLKDAHALAVTERAKEAQTA